MSSTIPYQLTLVSHVLCPYVQRSVIALEELGIDYKRIDIDLNNPPEWFNKISPLGKVPLLLVDDDVVLFESAVIAEFINEIANGDLLSSNSIDKAQQRAWIEFASATLDNIGQLYSAKAGKTFEQSKAALDGKWQILERQLASAPFFNGESFSLVDAAFAPVFRYLELFEILLDQRFLKPGSKVENWRKASAARDSVSKAVSPEYPKLLAKFVSERDSQLGSLASTYLADKIAA